MFTFRRLGMTAIAAAVLGAASWVNVSAQPYLELGFKGGLGLARLSGNDVSYADSVFFPGDDFYLVGSVNLDSGSKLKSGFIGGAYATVHFNDLLGIRLEALYAVKGGKGDVSGQLDLYEVSSVHPGDGRLTGTNRMRITYLEFPLLGVLSVPTGAGGTFDLFAGPEVAFMTTAKLATEVKLTLATWDTSATESHTVDISDGIKSTDFGGVLGAGLTYRLGGAVVSGEARWTHGFTDIPDEDVEVSVRNDSFAVMVGVGIPLGRSK